MNAQLTYTCGHPSVLANNRRGKARQEIIESVQSHLCPKCRLEAQASKLTRIDGTPYTAEEQAAYVAKRLPRVS